MSDSIICGVCGSRYLVRSYENWGTCTKCKSNNDRAPWDKKPKLAHTSEIKREVEYKKEK